MDATFTPLEQRRRTLQQTMNFASALADGIEQLVGRGAGSMTFVAGRKLGKSFSAEEEKTDDPLKALDTIADVLRKNNCLWGFEPFQTKGQENLLTERDDGKQEMQLVFRDCMIRQALFCYGHEQKGSLCTMMYGFFAGALEEITGRRASLEIIHAGENACLKRLVIEP